MKPIVLLAAGVLFLFTGAIQAAYLMPWDGGLWGQVDRYISDSNGIITEDPIADAGFTSTTANTSASTEYSWAEGSMSGEVHAASYWGEGLGTEVAMNASASCGSTDSTADVSAYGNVAALAPTYTSGIFFLVEGDSGEEPEGTHVRIQWRWSAMCPVVSSNAAASVGGEHMCITRNAYPPIENPEGVIWNRSSVGFSEPGEESETGSFIAQVGDVIGVFLSASASASLTGQGDSIADVYASVEFLVEGPLPALWEYPYAPGLVYDPVGNITFLKDWSAAASSTAWYDANEWAEDFSYTTNGITYSDWRLPTTTDEQGACVGEFGFLSSNYGISTDYTGPFRNLPDGDCWTAPTFLRDPDPAIAYAFTFIAAYGPAQWDHPLDYGCYAVPVFDGPPRERWCPADFNNDDIVNFVDFAVFSSYWLMEREEPQPM